MFEKSVVIWEICGWTKTSHCVLDENRYHSLANAELKGSVESKGISFYGMNKKMGEECDSDWKKNYICKIFLKMRKEWGKKELITLTITIWKE